MPLRLKGSVLLAADEVPRLTPPHSVADVVYLPSEIVTKADWIAVAVTIDKMWRHGTANASGGGQTLARRLTRTIAIDQLPAAPIVTAPISIKQCFRL